MSVEDHRRYSVPQVLVDQDICDAATWATVQWMQIFGGDKAGVNRALAQMLPEQAICFVTTLCGETHAGLTVILHGNPPQIIRREAFPLLSHQQALGKAVKMLEDYKVK